MQRSLDTRLSVTVLLVALVLLATGCGTLSEIVGPERAAPPLPLVAEASPPEPIPIAQLLISVGADGVGAPSTTSTSVAMIPQSSMGPAGAVATELAPERAGASAVPADLEEWLAPGSSDESTATSAAEPAGVDPEADAGGMAQARETAVTEADPEDYDPWERYNEWMFTVNYNVDRYVLKPTANVYRHIVPEPFQIMIANGFDNIRFPARLVNHVLQGRFWGAFIETSRFVINSTLGIGGLFNPATDYFGIPRYSADFGQTLAKWGIGPGPFFVPPFLPPATVRDFIGRLADAALNPLAWFVIPNFWPEGFSIGVGEMVNQRAVTYELFQGVEETTLDLYTAVRDGYLRRRERQLQQLDD